MRTNLFRSIRLYLIIGFGLLSNLGYSQCPKRYPFPQEEILTTYPELDNDSVIVIPVVFHLLVENPDIILEIIPSQLAMLNQAFNPTDLAEADPKWRNIAQDANIEFILLPKSADSRLTANGIIEKPTTKIFYRAKGGEELKEETISDLYDDTKSGSNKVEPGFCINIWVTNLIEISKMSGQKVASSSLEGFASYPARKALCPDMDGVVLNVSYFKHGTRTLAHEMGHYFGLYHLWGPEGKCGDDFMEDTPPQPSRLTINSLSSPILGKEIICGMFQVNENCTGENWDGPYMKGNYMSYSVTQMNNKEYDCRNFFTKDQVRWMRSQFNQGMPREELLWLSKAKAGDYKGAIATRKEIVSLVNEMLEEQIVGTWIGNSPMLTQYVNIRDQQLVITKGSNEKNNISIRQANSGYVIEEGELVRIQDQARWVVSIQGRKYWIDMIDPDLIRVVDSDLVNMILNDDRSKSGFDKITYFARKDWVTKGQSEIPDGSTFEGLGREDENMAYPIDISFSAGSIKISAEWPLSEEFRSNKSPDEILSVPYFQFKNAVFIYDQEQKWVSQTNKWTRLDNPTASGNPKAAFYRSQTGILGDHILKIYPDSRGVLYKIESSKLILEIGPIGDHTLMPALIGKIRLSKTESPFVPVGKDPFGKDMFEGKVSIIESDLWALIVNNQLIFCPSPYFIMPPSNYRKTNYTFGFEEWANLLQIYGITEDSKRRKSLEKPIPPLSVVKIKPINHYLLDATQNNHSNQPATTGSESIASKTEELNILEEPAPNAYIFAEEEPIPLNLKAVKEAIGYPMPARNAGIQGQVVVRVLVDENGKCRRHIVEKNPHPILTSAVEKQLQYLEFSPAKQGSKRIVFWVSIPFDFKP